ncbi:hypothetical protein GCM10010458_05130 [Microbacterium luteolum]
MANETSGVENAAPMRSAGPIERMLMCDITPPSELVSYSYHKLCHVDSTRRDRPGVGVLTYPSEQMRHGRPGGGQPEPLAESWF